MPADSPAPAAVAESEAIVGADVRHNVLALGADFSLFMIGLSVSSPSTILPAFAAELGASNLVIGAIPAVMTLGWFCPSLFVAGHTAALPRRLPFVLRWSLWERAPFLVLAATAFLIASRLPGLALAILLVMLLAITGTGGLLLPAWMDVVGRTIPARLRGRFFGVASLTADLGGLLGSVLTAYILARVAAPHSFGLCFAISAGLMALSFAALALIREPAVRAPARAVSLRAHLRRVPALLERDPNLRWFLVARALGALGAVASGFYTVYALRAFAAPTWQAGVFTTLFLAGHLAGSVVLGWLADRVGHRLVLIIGAAAIVGANGVALAAPSLQAFGVVFALTGVNQAAAHVSGLNVLLEFAPALDERPTYVGLGNTAMAPFGFAGPLAAGLLVDGVGFAPLFGTAGVLGLTAMTLLVARVRDPRHARAPAACVGPGG
jgi:MFS family permease